MSPVGPQNQQALLAKSKRPSEDPVSLRQLALVARRLGFHSSRIYQLASGDPHTEIAAETLLGIQQQSNYPNEGGSLQPALETTVDLVQEGESGPITSLFVGMCVYRVTFGDFQAQQDQLHLELRRVSLARHSSENGRPSKRSRTDGRFNICLVADDVDQTSLKEIEGNGDESHVQDVAVAVRILMSDWHPYDASSGSGLSIDDCFQSAINNSGKILMRRVY
ncbi:uncharacterized protein PpBr36_11136 [Pyricularia pennisetigena]|uniref:Uncharacterized protein n=1 Tax=Pyricularia oryzae TaxID=318829 RepID=A0A4P7NWB0_PYROR|nr:uncharacterized protein PpBr36_11136 [Pyricularia pennisetigena]QBZ66742.1 hypothetical protein PoMZ_13729 [Pyricularia oryzae]TLS20482.1 hypothetical protein PpBr36_11136 [Pyricularia pennisetigena]